MNYAVNIKNNIATLITVGITAEHSATAYGGDWVDVDYPVGIGWLWDGEKFVPPEPEPEPEE
jgi:hypothetical protein